MAPTRPFHITPHPEVDALSDDSLGDDFPSVASDVSAYRDAQAESKAVLDTYRAAHDEEEDDTPAFFDVVLDNLPKEGQITMMRELIQFKSNFEAIRQLRRFFTDAVLNAMKYSGNCELDISPSPHEDAVPGIEELKVLKEQCLRRDRFRCVLTGGIDITSAAEGHTTADGHLAMETECSHIIPFGLRKFNEDNGIEVAWISTVWWALYRYFPKLRGAIGPESVNQPENAMTLNLNMDHNFRKYRFAFQPSFATRNRYHVRQFLNCNVSIGIPSIHTFTSADDSIALPSEDFLRVHHSIAKMLHVSGIGARIEASRNEEFRDRMPRGAAPDGPTKFIRPY